MALNFLLAFATTAYGHKVLHAHAGHSHFEAEFKKVKPVNECEQIDNSLVVECPDGYELVQGEVDKYGKSVEYCESNTFSDPVQGCPKGSVQDEATGDCFEVVPPECPEGFSVGAKDKDTCYRSEFQPVVESCPDGYEIKEANKGSFCELTESTCATECPADTTVDPDTGACLVEARIFPNTCPEEYELSEDGEYCLREYTASCDRKANEKHSYGHGGHHHLRRLDGHSSHGGHSGSHGGHSGSHGGHSGSHGGSYSHGVVFKDDEKSHDKVRVKKVFSKDDAGAKDSHGVKDGHKFGGKLAEFKSKKDKNVAFSRLIDSECVYEEIIQATPVFETEAVEQVEVCTDTVLTEPIELVCEEETFEVVYRKYKEPVCVLTTVEEKSCPDGELDGECVLPVDPIFNCPVGAGVLIEGQCELNDVQPPTYQWILARQCTGYECKQYYEHSCIYK